MASKGSPGRRARTSLPQAGPDGWARVLTVAHEDLGILAIARPASNGPIV